MPRLARTRLTDTIVKRTTPREKAFEVRDAGQQGLVLRVQPSSKKSWVVQVDRATRRTIADATVINVEDARVMCREFLSTFDPENESKEPIPTLKTFLEGLFTSWIEKRSNYGERDTRRLVSALGNLSKVKLDKLTHVRIDRWMQDRNVAPATKNRELAQLKSALNRAVEWSILDKSPAQHVKLMKDRSGKRARYLEDDERKRLETAFKARDGDFISVMTKLSLLTGLRRGEVFKVEWADIDFDKKLIHVRATKAKSGKDRYVPMNNKTLSLLKAWRIKSGHRTGLLFRTRTGSRYQDIKRHWKKLMSEAEISDFRFHDCRHDFCSCLVMNGIDLYAVKELAGHSTITVTERYAHLRPDLLADAISVLDSI